MSTGERLVPESEVRIPPAPAALPLASLLAICDRVLDEIGRRRHLFAWLRDPDAGSEQWLPVDAYYPGNRVVVVSSETAAGHEELYAELVPAHGLKLLTMVPAELGGDPAAAKEALGRMIASLELPERRLGERDGDPVPPRENPVAKALQSLVPPPAPPDGRDPVGRRQAPPSQAAAAKRGARFVDAHKADLARGQRAVEALRPHTPAQPHSPARTPAPAPGAWRPSAPARGAWRPSARVNATPRMRARRSRSAIPKLDALGLVMGSALFAVLCAEIYLAVAVTWLNGGRALLGLGVLLDACCRLLGTIAARRVRSRAWAWACLIGGSPLVVWFAFFRRSGPVMTPPGPLAGLIGLPALGLIALGLVI